MHEPDQLSLENHFSDFEFSFEEDTKIGEGKNLHLALQKRTLIYIPEDVTACHETLKRILVLARSHGHRVKLIASVKVISQLVDLDRDVLKLLNVVDIIYSSGSQQSTIQCLKHLTKAIVSIGLVGKMSDLFKSQILDDQWLSGIPLTIYRQADLSKNHSKVVPLSTYRPHANRF